MLVRALSQEKNGGAHEFADFPGGRSGDRNDFRDDRIGRRHLFDPILVYGYGLDQKSAQGTSLATLLLPIGALAFWKYYSAGHVDLRLAALLALGFFVGGYFGGSLAQLATNFQLRRIFAVCLALIAVKMFLQK
jgi:uncharacterized membrane protein YfcA